jgi:hypothetical protein
MRGAFLVSPQDSSPCCRNVSCLTQSPAERSARVDAQKPHRRALVNVQRRAVDAGAHPPRRRGERKLAYSPSNWRICAGLEKLLEVPGGRVGPAVHPDVFCTSAPAICILIDCSSGFGVLIVNVLRTQIFLASDYFSKLM